MLPEDKLRATRLAIGASYRDMADLVGLAGANANDRLIEMEEGKRPVSGPMERALDYISQGVDLDGGDLGNAIMARYLPDFVELTLPAGQAGDDDFEALLHTRYPRFFAVFTELLPAPMRERLANEDLEQLEMPESTGLGKMVAIPLDRHHGSLKPLMAIAAKLVPAP
jgi:transcriptional regulator with XRE-family HTH domain